MIDLIARPWPWYVAGPVIGLFVPALLLLGNRQFGISNNLRHLCAAAAPCDIDFFVYDWKRAGAWNLAFLAGVFAGGLVTAYVIGAGDVALTPAARASMAQLGLHDLSGLAPREVFSWGSLLTLRGLLMLVGGGLLVGFGTAWAGGCTSGHAISGLAAFEPASLLAVFGFFGGGLVCTWFIIPLLF